MAGHDGQSESGRQTLRTDGLRGSETNICAYIGWLGSNEKYSKKDENMRWERDTSGRGTAESDRDSSQRNIKVLDGCWLICVRIIGTRVEKFKL